MIRIQNLVKEFTIYKKRFGIVKQLFGLAREGKDFDRVKSLKGINFEIQKGEVHGIIGMNGAGKSTLLKILTGVLEPTSGSYELKGRVAALLELGTGFHHELTGRENVFLNGSMIGLTRSEIQAKIASIEDFAELGEFFDRPVKVYSSGMYVRLAFAFAVSVEPDVLIVDEALSVGDAYFQQKCLKKIRSFKDKGTTILFVSHDLGAVRMLCDRVTLLSKGEMIYTGSPLQALDLYNALLADQRNPDLMKKTIASADAIAFERSYESGSKKVEIVDVKILNATDNDTQAVVTGDSVSVVVRAKINEGPIDSPTCGILIRDRLGYDVFGINSFYLGLRTGVLHTDDLFEFHFQMGLNLGQGDYTLTVAMHSDSSHADENYHWIERAKVFRILGSPDYIFTGVVKLDAHARISLLS